MNNFEMGKTNPTPPLEYLGTPASSFGQDAVSTPRQSTLSLLYGYGTAILGATSVFLEQSPANENLRIEKGLETLVATGDPHAVERTVQMVTMPIEAIPAAVIIAAVHSNNPVIEKARNSLGSWQEMGEKRAEYRAQVKLEAKAQRRAELNERRVVEGKKPKKDIDITDNPVGRFFKKELTDLGLALGLGAGIVVFKDALIDRERKLRQSILSAIKATIEISVVSGKIGYFVAAGTKNAKWDMPLINHTLHYEKQAQWLIDYGTDTKALMAILLTAYAPGTIYKIWHRLGKRETLFQSWLEEHRDDLTEDVGVN